MADLLVPDERTLRLFLLGRLVGPEAERVERYLEGHPEAADTLHGLAAEDTFTSALREPSAAQDIGPDVRTAMKKLEQLAQRSDEQTTPHPSGDDSRADATRSVAGPNEDDTEDGLQFLAPARGPGELGRLGPYRVLRVLGAGGMGMVLDAEDPQLGRHVAIKVMRPRVSANPRAKERFLREARSAAKVEHDHIVPVYFVGEDNGVPYIVMPFLKGESLDARLKRDGLVSVADILRIGREAAEGLAAAHEHGLVHRDIKPANLWLEAPRGRVKILDFGLARLNTDGHLTQSGAIVGTPAYMAPEQARSQGVDARSDLFSLGAVLYRMATGRTPFAGTDTMSMLMALANDTPAHPRSLNPDLPPHLADLIVRLLEKDPARRPQTAREVVQLLAPAPWVEALPDSGERRREFEFDADAATEVEPPRATPAEPETARSPKRKRGRGLTPVGIAVAVLALIGVTLGTYKLVFETRDGTLYVEITDPEAEVRFAKGELQILDAKGELKYTLKPSEVNKKVAPGEYKIRVTDPNGLEVDTPEFTMKKGGQVIVRVTAKAAPVAKKDPPAAGKRVDLLALIDPKRDAVSGRWKVDGGKLIGGGPAPYTSELLQVPFSPPAEYDTTLMVERTSPRDGKDENAHRAFVIIFAGPGRTQLILDYGTTSPVNGFQGISDQAVNTSVTSKVGDFFGPKGGPVRIDCRVRRDEIVIRIDGVVRVQWQGDVTSLKEKPGQLWQAPDKTRLAVGMHQAEYRIHEWTLTPVGGASANPDRQAAEYVLLVGGNARITENGKEGNPKEVSGLPRGPFELRIVDLAQNGKVTDAGLAGLKDCKDLTHLFLHATPVSDAGLAHLKTCTNLTLLTLHKTKVTAAGIAGMKKALPNCKIEWDGGVVEPKSPGETDRRLAEWVLKNGGVAELVARDQHLGSFSGPAARLPDQPFQLAGICFTAAPAVDDRALDSFRDLTGLLKLSLHGQPVTDAGLARFLSSPAAANLVFLSSMMEQVGDAGLQPLPKLRHLTQLAVRCPQVTDATLSCLRDLPLTHLDINGTITGAGLAALTGKRLKMLNLSGCAGVDDRGMAALKDTPTLESVFLPGTRVGDAGLAHLTANTNLVALKVGYTQVTAAGLDHLARFPKMVELSLWGLPIPDDGLAKLKGLLALANLDLRATKVADAGMEHLKGLTTLRALDLRETQVTAAGVKKLATALPLCKIEWDGPVVEPKSPAELDRLLAERALKAGGVVHVKVTNDDIREIRPGGPLPDGPFGVNTIILTAVADPSAAVAAVGDLLRLEYMLDLSNRSVTDATLKQLAAAPGVAKLPCVGLAGSMVTDTGLSHLKGMANMHRLFLNNTGVGDAGLAHVRNLPLLNHLQLNGTAVTDAGLTELARIKGLLYLDVRKTKVTEAGVKKLAAAVPGCQIEWDGGTVGPTGPVKK